jgi:hypothetical protein
VIPELFEGFLGGKFGPEGVSRLLGQRLGPLGSLMVRENSILAQRDYRGSSEDHDRQDNEYPLPEERRRALARRLHRIGVTGHF